MTTRPATPASDAHDRDRRAIRWLVLKVAVFLLVPALPAALIVPLSLR